MAKSTELTLEAGALEALSARELALEGAPAGEGLPRCGSGAGPTSPGTREFLQKGVKAKIAEESEMVKERRCFDGLGRHGKVVLFACVLALLLVFGLANGERIKRFLDSVLVRCATLGWRATVLVLVVIALLTILMLPTFPLMVGAAVEFTKMYGASTGTAVGIASVFGGVWLGSIASFQLGRTIWKNSSGREQDQHTTVAVINKMVEEEGVKVVFFARMCPFMPAELFNYACSVTGLSLPQYCVGCLGSIVPVSIWVSSAVQATDVAGDPSKKGKVRDIILVVVNLLLMMALTIVLCRSYRKFKRRLGTELDGTAPDVETKEPAQELQRRSAETSHF